MKRRLRFWLWAAYVLLSFFVMQLTLRPFARYFFFFALLLAPVSLLLALWQRRRLRAHFSPEAEYISRGSQARWTLSLGNPLPHTIILEDDAAVLLRPAAKWSREYTQAAVHTGPLEPPVPTLRMRDPLGFFSLPLSVPDAPPVFVLPEPLACSGPRLREGELLSVFAMPVRSQSEQQDLSGARLLRPGDPMKRIHWKLSSRLREWVVREEESHLLSRLILLLDIPASLEEDPGARDQFLDRVAGMKLSSAAAGHTDLRAYAPGPESARFFQKRELLEQLARIPRSGYLSVNEQLLREARSAGALYMILSPRPDRREIRLSRELRAQYPVYLYSLAKEAQRE